MCVRPLQAAQDKAGFTAHLSKRTDTRSMATITDSLSGAAALASEVLPGLTFSFPETSRSGLSLCRTGQALQTVP